MWSRRLKFLYFIFGFLALCIGLGITLAQSEEIVCFSCPPSEVITDENISRIHKNGIFEGNTYDFSFSPNSQFVAAIRADRAAIYKQSFWSHKDNPSEYDWLSWGWSQTVTRDNHLTQVAFHPEGNILAIGDDTGQVSFWDIEESNLVHTSNGQSYIAEMVYHPDGNSVITLETPIGVAQLNSEGVYVLTELEGYYAIAEHDMEEDAKYFDLSSTFIRIPSISMSADGRWLVASADNRLLIYDISTGSLIKEIVIRVPNIDLAMFDESDSHNLFILTDRVDLWRWSDTPTDIVHVATFESILREKDNYPIMDAAISPDGSILITVDYANCIRTWDIIQRQEIETLLSVSDLCTDTIYDIAFSPDGLWLVYGSTGFHAWVVP